MYLVFMDDWDTDKSNDSLKLDMDTKTVSSLEFCVRRTAFATMQIKKGDINRWKIKVLTQKPDAVFGIFDASLEETKLSMGILVKSEC